MTCRSLHGFASYLLGLFSTPAMTTADNYLVHSVEGLPETELDSLQTALRGVNIFVGDYVFTYVETEFFVRLAESHGRPADVDFLKAYAGRDLGSESVQDCVHFGTDLIVNQRGAWIEFRVRHPHDYVRFVAAEAQNVIEELMGSCACGDSPSVEAELDHFLRRFPDDPIAPQVRARLASTLAEIRELLRGLERPRAVCDDVCQVIEGKIGQIDHELSRLRSQHERLSRLRAACPRTRPLRECPVVVELKGTTPTMRKR